MYDVAIVGARCAGSALALSLARHGLKVIIIDRTRFPSDTMSGHYIHPAGVSALRRLGLREDLERLGSPALRRMSIDFGSFTISGAPTPARDGTVDSFAPRRWAFDPVLAEAAVAVGAELREATNFTRLVFDGRQVKGIATVSTSGRVEDVRARLVVGADGKRSRVAAQAGARVYDTVPARTCTYYAYWKDLPIDRAELYVRDGRFAVALPTNEGLTFLAVAWPVDRFGAVRKDVETAYLAAVCELPSLADRLVSAKRVGRFTGTADTEGFFREAAGPGWALVGDAGYHKDPITAQGMTDAFLHAELLSECVVDGLGGARNIDAALMTYSQRRDALAKPLYDMTAELARLSSPSPEVAALLAAVAVSPGATSEFLGIMAGTVHPQEFFAAPNVERILELAGRPKAA
ncbi:FAD-dependent oxidoreductase [Aestuariivirga sp.]|uniref:FAD-dependent oxidoreductase n=1 Tax=Aestuariivirga sp. TaxID=2650926 RepID=UPI00391DF256